MGGWLAYACICKGVHCLPVAVAGFRASLWFLLGGVCCLCSWWGFPVPALVGWVGCEWGSKYQFGVGGDEIGSGQSDAGCGWNHRRVGAGGWCCMSDVLEVMCESCLCNVQVEM